MLWAAPCALPCRKGIICWFDVVPEPLCHESLCPCLIVILAEWIHFRFLAAVQGRPLGLVLEETYSIDILQDRLATVVHKMQIHVLDARERDQHSSRQP